MRIVSLLASATEIVCSLGLEEQLVGISHECDHPSRILDRPRVSRPRFDPEGLSSGEVDRAVRQAVDEHGSVYQVDGEALEELGPDLILTQAVCEVCAVPTSGVRELVDRRSLDATVLSLDAHTLEEVLDSVVQVGEAAGAPAEARRLRDALQGRLEAVEDAVSGRAARDVLALEWLDPPFVPGHWVPEMVERAGGRCLVGQAGRRSREVEPEALEGLDPDALLVTPCGYGLEASRREADLHAAWLESLAPEAVSRGRAFVVDASSYFNRSGPRVVDGVEILAGLLHPDAVDPPHPGNAARWSPAGERAPAGAG